MIMVVVVRAQMMMVVVTMDIAHLERPWESCWSENKGFCDSLSSQRERAEALMLLMEWCADPADVLMH